MPTTRGTIRRLIDPADAETLAAIVITNDRWNTLMSTVAVVPIRALVEDFERPSSVQLADGTFAVAGRLTSVVAPSEEQSMLGAVISVLPAGILEQLDDRLYDFLQIPLLLTAGTRRPHVVGDPTAYPHWGDIYFSRALINDERKRFIVVSPNTWNAASERVVIVRTTTKDKRAFEAFPKIQHGQAHAWCGETLSVKRSALLTATREPRPRPSTTTSADMAAVVRGIAVTHGLADAFARRGISAP